MRTGFPCLNLDYAVGGIGVTYDGDGMLPTCTVLRRVYVLKRRHDHKKRDRLMSYVYEKVLALVMTYVRRPQNIFCFVPPANTPLGRCRASTDRQRHPTLSAYSGNIH